MPRRSLQNQVRLLAKAETLWSHADVTNTRLSNMWRSKIVLPVGLPHPAWQAGTQAMKRAKQQASSSGHESTSGCPNWWCPTFRSSDNFFSFRQTDSFLGIHGKLRRFFEKLSQGDRVVWILFIYSVGSPEMNVAFPHRPLAGYGGYGGGGGGYGGGGYGGGGYGGGDYGGRLAPQNLRSIKTTCAKMRRQWYTDWPAVYLHSMEKIQPFSWNSQLWLILNVSSLYGNHHSVKFNPSFSKAMVAVVVATRCEVGISEFHDAVIGSLVISCFPNAERGPGYGKDGKDGGKSKVLCHPLGTDYSLSVILFASIVSLIFKLFWFSEAKQILPACGNVQLSWFDLEQSSCRERESTTETVAQKALDTEIWLFLTELAFHGFPFLDDHFDHSHL